MENRPLTSGEEDSRNEGRAPRQQEDMDSQEPSPSPSAAMSTDSPSPSGPSAGRSSPRRTTVDRLVKKLSKHNLQLDNRAPSQSEPPPQQQQQQQQQQPLTQPDSSYCTYSPAPWPKIEIDTRPGQSISTGLYGCISPWGPPPMLHAGEPIEVDDDPQEEPLDITKLTFKRMRRQPSGMGMRQKSSSSSSSRSAGIRLEQMIASETQCKVRREALSASAASSPSSQSVTMIAAEPGSIEVDPDYSMPNWNSNLEVDPEYLKGNFEEDEAALLEDSRLALRDAAGPSGIRKHAAGGVQLRYRLSVDAALRCQNVVRSRPRMRKRDKSRFPSSASSAVGSIASSPIMAPTYTPS
ncbi:hypothetical protein QBC43DRAFT_200223 [Cladorrhinum sp. PSN259]|nr:hypothetical protein QBC43DRAFT_200223 [Cladorrhinum sp. PSN259]